MSFIGKYLRFVHTFGLRTKFRREEYLHVATIRKISADLPRKPTIARIIACELRIVRQKNDYNAQSIFVSTNLHIIYNAFIYWELEATQTLALTHFCNRYNRCD